MITDRDLDRENAIPLKIDALIPDIERDRATRTSTLSHAYGRNLNRGQDLV
jgi:hypothetical protein